MRFRVLLAFSMAMATASAQVAAVIAGTVTDPSGAAVSGAVVTIKNLDRGAARTTVTDDSGRYRTGALPVGEYEILASKQGFKETVRSGVRLAVGQEAAIDLSLEVGEMSQQVTVSADAA